MRSWWSTGWVKLPGTVKHAGIRWHRPHPERPEKTLCGRVCAGKPVVSMLVGETPKGIKCAVCEVKVERGRHRAKLAGERQQRERTRQRDDEYRARVEKYGGYVPGSVRAASAGLPGLGRRR